MWVEFVVGSNPCPKRLIFGYSGFPLLSLIWNEGTHLNIQALKTPTCYCFVGKHLLQLLSVERFITNLTLICVQETYTLFSFDVSGC